MADLVMCAGTTTKLEVLFPNQEHEAKGECPIRHNCYRFRATPDDDLCPQAWFEQIHYTNGQCESFMPIH